VFDSGGLRIGARTLKITVPQIRQPVRRCGGAPPIKGAPPPRRPCAGEPWDNRGRFALTGTMPGGALPQLSRDCDKSRLDKHRPELLRRGVDSCELVGAVENCANIGAVFNHTRSLSPFAYPIFATPNLPRVLQQPALPAVRRRRRCWRSRQDLSEFADLQFPIKFQTLAA